MTIDRTYIEDGHVVWERLDEDEQLELEANYPHQEDLTDAQFQAWLDTAYRSRHSVAEGIDPELAE